MDRPVLIFDGDCYFCRQWVDRWKRWTGDKVDYVSSQEAAQDFPAIPPEDFQKAVQLIEPDGRRSRAAEAVFRTLRYAGSPGWFWAYQKVPGFSALTEFFYGVVAGNRPAFSFVSRWVWGTPAEPSSYRLARWVFLRALAAVYAVAFWSYGTQIKGLNGSLGILPAHEFLGQMTRFGAMKYWDLPTLAWLNSSDPALVDLCFAGGAVSVLLFLNIAPRVCLALSWILYLSLVSVGGDFMNFQWDALLLETGFLAVWFAPAGLWPQSKGVASPPRPVLFLLRWLLFRLMVQSALAKWFSGDPLWHSFSALTVYYQTQPLPNPVSWFVHQWPMGFHQVSCILMFVIEGIVPFLIFAPRRPRLVSFWILAGFQGLIILTGNYSYFNWLSITLCLILLDDEALRPWLPLWCVEPPVLSPATRTAAIGANGLRALSYGIFFLTLMPFGEMLGIRWPAWVLVPAEAMSPLRSFNRYGLFAVMTAKRSEIILEGSPDGENWRTYEFKFKPGDLSRRPKQVAPDQPRLDWQMWFAALGDYRQSPWFINFCVRLLQGSPPVIALLRHNPFPDQPPVYLRARAYEYRFTTPEERRRTGNWWVREDQGPYCPVLSLKRDKRDGL